MGERSSIEWTDHTFNPWWGCTRVSPGCVHCYAETFDKRVHGKDKAHWGVKAERRFFGDAHWREPVKWNAKAEAAGLRERVFCASMADVFEDRPELVEHRARLFALILATPALDWLLLTKRPENMIRLAVEAGWEGDWPENVWAGCTVEDQQRADERIPELLQVPARVRFLSCEPLLGALNLPWLRADFSCMACGYVGPDVDLDVEPPLDWKCPVCGDDWSFGLFESDPRFGHSHHAIDWVICGGESGHGARPMHPDWARSLRDQCTAAGVAFHFKQWGEHQPREDWPWDERPRDARAVIINHAGGSGYHGAGAIWTSPVGKHAAGRLLDGRTWDELPTPAPVEVPNG